MWSDSDSDEEELLLFLLVLALRKKRNREDTSTERMAAETLQETTPQPALKAMAKTREQSTEEAQEEKTTKRRENKKIMRKHRQKIKKNPTAIAEERRKARERYQQRKEKGFVKTISDLSRLEQENVRKQWRERSWRYRNRIKMAQCAEKVKDTTPSFVYKPNTPSTLGPTNSFILGL